MAWVMIESTNQEYFHDEYYVDEGGSPVAIVNGEANARRIALVPEMFEALEGIAEGFKMIDSPYRSEPENAVLAVIAKAKGE